MVSKIEGVGVETENANEEYLINGVHQTYYPYSYISGYYLKTTDGTDTPNFFRRKRAGDLLPLNSYEQREQKILYTVGGWDIVNGSGAEYKGSTFPKNVSDEFDLMPSPDLVNAWIDEYSSDIYIEAALASMYTRGWDALTFAAELRDTIRLFNGIIPRFRKYLNNHNPRDWANVWLESRYGWRSLSYDLQDLRTLVENLQKTQNFQFYTERQGDSFEFTKQTSTPLSVPGYWSGTWLVDHQCKLSVRGTVVSKTAPPAVTFDVSTTLWEVTRLSFVVDWLVSIGTSLAAANAAVHHSDFVSALGHQLEVTSIGRYTDVSLGSGWIGHIDGSSLAKTVYSQRIPAAPDYIPSFSVNLSPAKVLDLISLVLQRSK
jgi:hypothetical protein